MSGNSQYNKQVDALKRKILNLYMGKELTDQILGPEKPPRPVLKVIKGGKKD